MPNDFYTKPAAVSRHTTARAATPNNVSDAVDAAFDKLPSEVSLQRGANTFAVDSGAANAYVVAMPKTWTALSDGGSVRFRVGTGNTNTGSATINVDSLGARAIKRMDGTDVVAGDLTAGRVYELVYDLGNTYFRLLSYVSTDQTSINTVASNIADVNTVAGIDSDVSTVAGISANVTAVAGDATDIGTVAGISGAVSTVAGINAAVSTVAADGADIGAVAAISTDVQAVGPIAADVTAVANIAADVSAVEAIVADVTTVAGIPADVIATAGISADITTLAHIEDGTTATGAIQAVAAIDTDVTAVANISGNVTTVSGIAASVSAVAAVDTEVGTVAGIAANITTVAGIAANVTTVAGLDTEVTALGAISTEIGTVATNIADVGTVADNMASILSALTGAVQSDEHATLAAGFDSGIEPLGTITSGTVTPEVDGDTKPNFKTMTNNGSGIVLDPPSTSSATTIRIRVINGASAGAIDVSAFDGPPYGDTYDTTAGKEWWFWIDHDGTRSTLTIKEIVI